MKNSELTLNLIDLDEDKEVVILISGNYHKITGLQQLGGKILLNVEGSIQSIDRDHSEFYDSKYPNSTLIESVK